MTSSHFFILPLSYTKRKNCFDGLRLPFSDLKRMAMLKFILSLCMTRWIDEQTALDKLRVFHTKAEKKIFKGRVCLLSCCTTFLQSFRRVFFLLVSNTPREAAATVSPQHLISQCNSCEVHLPGQQVEQSLASFCFPTAISILCWALNKVLELPLFSEVECSGNSSSSRTGVQTPSWDPQPHSTYSTRQIF